jgi:hypothetical protein
MTIGNLSIKERDIYKMFNYVRIADSEFDALTADTSAVNKERIKKVLTRRIKRQRTCQFLTYGSAAVAMVLLCLAGIGMALPSFADNVPVLNSIIQMLNDSGGFHGAYAEYSKIVNTSVTDNGLTLTVNEVVADDSRLIIGYTVKSANKIRSLGDIGLTDSLKINGKYYSSVGSGEGEYLDDYTYAGYEEVHPQALQQAATFNVDLDVFEIAGQHGKWDFAFSASKDELSKQSIVFRPKNVLDFPNSVATVDRVVFSPIDTSIFVSGKYKVPRTAYTPGGIIFDYDYWLVYDDQGVELVPKSVGGGSSNGQSFQSEMDFDIMTAIPKYLTVIPCKITPSMEGGGAVGSAMSVTRGLESQEVSSAIDGAYPIVLAQGKMGRLIIWDVKTGNDQTTVEFTAEGIAPYVQATELYLKDDQGETLAAANHTLRRNDHQPDEFTVIFPGLDPHKRYSLATNNFANFEIRDDLQFRIELVQ